MLNHFFCIGFDSLVLLVASLNTLSVQCRDALEDSLSNLAFAFGPSLKKRVLIDRMTRVCCEQLFFKFTDPKVLFSSLLFSSLHHLYSISV
ncbi:hypothetical protein VNO78_22380 [Psophocarpus tetragonolobus]|uniref:Secreted protein n=1 Tax=Psophocarpus tetragonolobus TaxID=3891 RepID=A0AAN9XJ10_PSOTE